MKSLILLAALVMIGCAAKPAAPVQARTSAGSAVAEVQMPVIPAFTPVNGTIDEFYPDGKPKSSREYQNGKIGAVEEYWPNGKPMSVQTYENGKIQQASYFSSNGTEVFTLQETAETGSAVSANKDFPHDVNDTGR